MAKGSMSTLLIAHRKNSKCSKASVAGYLMAAKGALNLDAVVGSNISGGSIDVTSGADTNITASTVVADNDVNIKTGGELNIGTQEQTSESEYIVRVNILRRLERAAFLSEAALALPLAAKNSVTNTPTRMLKTSAPPLAALTAA